MSEIFDRPAGRTLSEIIDSMQDIENILIETGGELTPELEAFMAMDSKELADKVDGYNAALREYLAKADAIKTEIARLTALKKNAENNAKRVRELLKYNMERLGAERVDGNFCKAYFSTSTGVEANEEVLLAPYAKEVEALRAALPSFVKVSLEVGKTELKEELKKEGAAIEGAALVSNKTIVIK